MAGNQTPPVPPQAAPVSGGGGGRLDADSFARIDRATRYVEKLLRNDAPAAAQSGRAGVRWTAIARVTTTITAASGGTYGTGTVTFQKDTGSALADDSTMAGIAVKNMTSKAIASGTTSRVFLAWGLGSWWVVAVYDCALLS